MFNKKTDQEENKVNQVKADNLAPSINSAVVAAVAKADPVTKDSKWREMAKQVAYNLAGWQKALADYQNLQKDTEKRISQLRDFVKMDLIHDLLPIFDNYQKALVHVPENMKTEPWVIGLEHTMKMWETFLADQGIKKIETVGKDFDTRWHESIGLVSDERVADQMIVEEKQTGHVLNDMVIRPAKVIINNISK